MINPDQPFTIESAGETLQVQPRKAMGSTVYVVRFNDQRQPLVVTRAHGEKRPVFWTSIPEGRQREAEVIGPLITAHYQAVAAAGK